MLFIGFLAALVSIFVINVATADPLIVQSESLRNFMGCSAEQQNQIYSAWDEAIDLAKEAYGWMDVSSLAKRDFFGYGDYVDDDSWNRIKGKALTPRFE